MIDVVNLKNQYLAAVGRGSYPTGGVNPPRPPGGGSPYQRLINSGKFHPTGPPQKIRSGFTPPGGGTPLPGPPPGGQIILLFYIFFLFSFSFFEKEKKY